MITEDSVYLNQMRKRIFLTACSGGIAHLASAFSCAEILYALYMKKILNVDPDDPWNAERDRLILSKGHASLALYTALAMRGFFPESELSSFLQPGSRLGGEPCRDGLPGIETTTGSLGHGLAVGIGIALAGKLDQKNYRTFVILGDGECQEGTIWEAVMIAHKYQLAQLTVILDANGIQKMGHINETMRILEWRSKFESFGWRVDEISDGHDVDEICKVLCSETADNPDAPRLVIAHTVKGKGVSLMENNPNWHFKMPNKRETKIFLSELGISEEEYETCKRRT